MRYLVLTDIHANLEALEACVRDATARQYDRAIVLGDVVGYGADPNAVVDRILALDPLAIVRGNHDKVACGLDSAEGFNPIAKSAARWTLETLTSERRAWLAALPRGPVEVDDFVEICHGSPFDEDAYVFDELDAARALRASTRPLCLFGHTHFPAAFALTDQTLETIGSPPSLGRIEMTNGSKYLINPGSVGQPRDGDPRAAYALVDNESRHIEMFRVPYAIEEAQAKLIRAGLPDALAHRLSVGR
jgi:diadenosine tetraphosphatase ApaH/serine/threonine PP2A family protein phosphatase